MSNSYVVNLRCADKTCGTEYKKEANYVCEDCFGPLEVNYDYQEIKKNLTIEKTQDILNHVEIEKQKLLLNTLGGRMPYGFRIAGKNGEEVREKVLNRLDRTIRRLITVANRIDESLKK